MSAFPHQDGPGAARTQMAVLHRLDVDRHNGTMVLLVQSGVKPNWVSLPDDYLIPSGAFSDNPATKSIVGALQNLHQGQVLRFRLRANPTRKIDTKSGPDGQRRHGRRVELGNETQQVEWLSRKAQQGGFHLLPALPGNEVPAVRVSATETHRGNGRSGTLTVASVLFEGLLEIDDAEQFRRTISAGIGPSRSFGCGLISVAPHRRNS